MAAAGCVGGAQSALFVVFGLVYSIKLSKLCDFSLIPNQSPALSLLQTNKEVKKLFATLQWCSL